MLKLKGAPGVLTVGVDPGDECCKKIIWKFLIDGLVQDCSNSSALALANALELQ